MKTHDGKKIVNDQHYFVMEKTVNKNGLGITKLFSCDICHKDFKVKQNLQWHIKHVHVMNSKDGKLIEIACEHCSKIFKNLSYLNFQKTNKFHTCLHMFAHIIYRIK